MHAALANGRILVLGYGNPGRQDDGLGPAAAEAIELRNFAGVTASANYQLMIEDASDAAESETVIFIDAAKTGGKPFTITPVYPANDVAAFVSHFVRPELVLGLSGRVYGHVPPAWLIGVRGYEFGFHEGLTDRARENLEHAIAHLCDIILERVAAPAAAESGQAIR